MTIDATKPDALDVAWASPANAPADNPTQKLMEDLMKRLEDESKWVNRITAMAGIALAIFTLRILYDIIATPGVFDPAKEWATVVLLVLPWIALFVVRSKMSRSRSSHDDNSMTLSEMQRAALSDNSTAKWRIRFLGLFLVLGAAFTTVALFQLIESGKMTERNAMQGAILFGCVLAAVGLNMAFHYFRVLKPEGRRLAQLLSDSED